MYNDLFSIGGLTVHGYGLCIGIGIAAALLLIWRRAEERKFDVQSVNTLILLILAAGFAGAKLFFVFAHWNEFCTDPLGTLGSEGFVVYGGIVCGLGAAYLYCRKRSLPFLRWVDCFIPCAALAQGFGRIGCFLAGCCFGKPTESFLGVTFPRAAWLRPGIPALAGAALFGGGRFPARRSAAASGKETPRRRAARRSVSSFVQHRPVSDRVSARRSARRGRNAFDIAVHALFSRAAGAAISLRKRGTPHG